MANQNPQPEVYTTRHVFGDNAAVISAGTRVTQTVYTNQANNEEVMVHLMALMVLFVALVMLLILRQLAWISILLYWLALMPFQVNLSQLKALLAKMIKL